MGKRELIALLNLSSLCLMMVERLFLAVPRGCLQIVIVLFPDHIHLLFIMLIYELHVAKNMQMGKRTDFILSDFSKAFDKVAHEKLLLKLHHYGIRGDILKWIKEFLDNRKQAFVVTGINSDKISISSGVPQGSILGPIMFSA